MRANEDGTGLALGKLRNSSLVGLPILFAFGYGFVPEMLQILFGVRPIAQLGQTYSQIPISAAAESFFQIGTVVAVALALIHDLSRRVTYPKWLFLYALPCIAVSVSTFMSERTVGLAAFIFIIFGLLVSVHPEPRRVLRLVGALIFAVAIVSLLMGWFAPSLALVNQAGIPDAKALIGSTLLVGPTYHPNNLGQVLAIGIPGVLAFRRPRVRIVALVVVGFALAWSGSRTSLTAVVIGFSVAAVWSVLRMRRNFLLRTLVVVVYAALLPITVLIVVTNSDPAAYSGRGYIWSRSLEYVGGSWVFGFGADIFAKISQSSASFGSLAYHGHNMFVNALMISGVVGLLALAALDVALLASSWRAGRRGDWGLSVWPVVFIVLGWLESPTNFFSFSFISWAAWPAIAVSLAQFRRRSEPLERVEFVSSRL